MPSGTYALLETNIGGSWQPYPSASSFEYWYENVTIPEDDWSTTFSIPLVQDYNEDYDRTGTLLVYTNCEETGLSSATLTDLDNNTPMGVAVYYGGYLYNSAEVLEGGLSGANQAIVYFYRNQTNTQSRTINYSTNSAASGDYSPSFGSITIPQGNWYASTTISANNATQSTTNALNIQLLSGTYAINSDAPTTSVVILPDYPTISVQAGPTNIIDGGVNGSAVSTFLIQRDVTYAAGAAKTVSFSMGGTASGGSDYTPSLGTSVTPTMVCCWFAPTAVAVTRSISGTAGAVSCKPQRRQDWPLRWRKTSSGAMMGA